MRKYVNDSVHGIVQLHPSCWAFIDTEEFQRLRDVKQTGCVSLVFPGAVHTRFEHCLGVAYLAELWVKHLKEEQEELQIDERDVECVTLAGLLHDLGHGPFSHMFDGPFIDKVKPGLKNSKGQRWGHEDMSKKLLDYLVEKNNLNISLDKIRFIKALIAGEVNEADEGDRKKPFLFQIVANHTNSVDVDKFDYLCRDGKYLGFNTNGCFITRLINSSRVLQGEICFRNNTAADIYSMFHTRFLLHKNVYTHKATKAMERMMVDAMVAADPVLNISEAIDKPELFIHLNDDIVNRIQRGTDVRLKKAQAIIKRLKTRKLYTFVDEILYKENMQFSIPYENIGVKDVLKFVEDPTILEEDVFLDKFKINFAMGDKNPMDSIHLYGRYKKHDDYEFSTLNLDSQSNMFAKEFQDRYIRIYYRGEDRGKLFAIQKGFLAMLKYNCNNKTNLINVIQSENTIPCAQSPMKRRREHEQESPVRREKRTHLEAREISFP